MISNLLLTKVIPKCLFELCFWIILVFNKIRVSCLNKKATSTKVAFCYY
jgi:hypothetical protein